MMVTTWDGVKFGLLIGLPMGLLLVFADAARNPSPEACRSVVERTEPATEQGETA